MIRPEGPNDELAVEQINSFVAPGIQCNRRSRRSRGLSPGEAASMSALVANTGYAVELVEIEKRFAAVESYQTSGVPK
jgi:hypothetical protein